MKKKHLLITLLLTLLPALTPPAVADILLVPAGYPTIQAAIDDANNGDTVIIEPGTYTGTGNRDIDFLGKSITVSSINPDDPDVVAGTIIDCNGSENDEHRAFILDVNEDANSSLAGLTITNGYTGQGGAVYLNEGSLKIDNCLFLENSSRGRAGVIEVRSYSSVVNNYLTVTDCKFINNSAGINGYSGAGGAIFDSSRGGTIITVKDSVFTGNSASSGGAVSATFINGTYTNCIFEYNTAREVGGAVMGTGNYYNCVFNKNSAQSGAAAYISDRIYNSGFTNCTITNNISTDPYHQNKFGAIAYYSRSGNSLQITNSIIWGNEPAPFYGLTGRIFASYSNIQGGYDGIGNINEPPLFAVDGDYHLGATSPCIDAGTLNDPNLPLFDLYGNPRIIDGNGDANSLPDMGAVEFDPELPVIAVSDRSIKFINGFTEPAHTLTIGKTAETPLNWQITEDCNWLSLSKDHGSITDAPDFVEILVDPNGLAVGDHSCKLTVTDTNGLAHAVDVLIAFRVGNILRVPSQYPTIQEAVNAAIDYDIVLVADGQYEGASIRKNLVVKSENGPENCIIDASNISHGVGLHSSSWGANAKIHVDINGFTIITNGHGIWFYHEGFAKISNCNIKCVEGAYGMDIGVPSSSSYHPLDVEISNCSVTGGYSAILVAARGDLKIKDCYIETGKNETYPNPKQLKGIIANTDSTLIENCIVNNVDGTAIKLYSNAQVNNCIITGNGTGLHITQIYKRSYYDPPLVPVQVSNCLIAGNDQPLTIYNIRSANFNNCTFADNIKSIFENPDVYPNVNLSNCIVWDNEPNIGINPYAEINYSNIRGGYQGTGNIDADPCFITTGYWDANNTPNDVNDDFFVPGDYRLVGDSPCIEAGDPNYVPAQGTTDLDGNPRLAGRTVDMGAYELPPAYLSLKELKIETKKGKRGNKIDLKGSFKPLIPLDLPVHDVNLIITDSAANELSFFFGAGTFEQEVKGKAKTPTNQFKFDSPKHSSPQIRAKFDLDKSTFDFKAKKVKGTHVLVGPDITVTLTAGPNTGSQTVPVKTKRNHLEYKLRDRHLTDLFKTITAQWLRTDCTAPDYCNGADLNQDGQVNFQDLAAIKLFND
jgi:hypothetical protein